MIATKFAWNLDGLQHRPRATPSIPVPTLCGEPSTSQYGPIGLAGQRHGLVRHSAVKGPRRNESERYCGIFLSFLV